MSEKTPNGHKQLDPFDRHFGDLVGLPDVTRVKATTVTAAVPITGEAQTFIIQTVRRREQGDTIFLQYIDAAGSVRVAIPPKAAEAIAAQREALTKKNRRLASKASAQVRKAAGIEPAFLKKKPCRKPNPGG